MKGASETLKMIWDSLKTNADKNSVSSLDQGVRARS